MCECHLRGYKCNCGNDDESTICFFLHCLLNSDKRHTLLIGLVNIGHTLLDNTNFSLTPTRLFLLYDFSTKITQKC